MSLPARLQRALTEPDPARIRLGPATVTQVLPAGAVEVALADGVTVPARFALPIPYEPREGDSLLVIGDAAGHYVIGVLAGTGHARLELQGDVTLRAVNGDLHLRADRAVRVEAPELSLRARKLGMFADALVQRFVTARQRVVELFELQAGESRTTVEGAAHTQAGSATVLTRDAVVINGKAVHLG